MRSQLESIRPIIEDIDVEKITSPMESFQNRTLRPILKFQNSIILSIFRNHLEKHKIIFYEFTDNEKIDYIEQIIKKDRKIHNLLLGIVIGHFTEIEYLAYLKYEKELNRRIMNMLIQRLENQL
jgi:hypothetical protein